ncbi:TetR/AcrR family transcriptional regulator [Ferrimonas balearica]|uniref:TetR/AcrR family transcriptional regulator n=1 Tax=Ferrimonas balearica TaxID=44012 RepID=UPI001C99BD7D|nr:TetR/AcrR family transcriptional regulator [Ferrimonas balearica]MBY5920136.1 TetR/AcrR family transcriptional regulator [Ferrimonas balearica]MBY5997179.1 TetR/AcrR family transcriptional regulator [Ferrimonas balearica]
MVDKRSGRQSAEAAEQTKRSILCAAADLFSQKGFDKVSVREISEAAGVSHGLIRHHFGSKEQIWHRICDEIHLYIQGLMHTLVEETDPALPPNKRLFQMMVRLMASLLIDPRPSRLAASAMGSKEELFDYLYDLTGNTEKVFLAELERTQQAGYLTDSNMAEIKWFCCMFSDAPATLRPLLTQTYGSNNDEALLAHWRLFARLIAPLLGIEESEIPDPKDLRELMVQGTCVDGHML